MNKHKYLHIYNFFVGVLQDVVKINKWLLGVSTSVPLPYMRRSCPHDIVGSGLLGSTLGEHKVTGVIMW